jgi:predicted metalloprotease with PDZ domain
LSSRRSKTYTDETLQKSVEEVAGKALPEFFRRYVVGDEPLAVNEFLEGAGLRVITDKVVVPQDIGIYFNRANNKIHGLVTDGAGHEAGLRPGDTVLSINGEDIGARPFLQFFTNDQVGAAYTFRVMRDGKELTFEVKVRPYEKVTVKVEEMTDASEQQLKVRGGIFGLETKAPQLGEAKRAA